MSKMNGKRNKNDPMIMDVVLLEFIVQFVILLLYSAIRTQSNSPIGMLIRGTTLYCGSYFPVKKGYKKV